VNSLVAHYNDRSNQDRREEAAKNEEFINGRLAKIDQELDLTDADWEKVKKQYKVTDPKVDAEEVMKKKSTYESQIVNIGIQQQMLDYLSEYVNNPANMYELIPVTIIGNGRDSIPLVNRHNQLVNERKKMLKSMTEQSVQVNQNKQMIKELHPAILTSILRNKEALMMQRTAVEREHNKYLSRVGDAPEQERVLTDVNRQRTIKQGVFVSLLQKREEIAMELANTTDKGRLIDETQSLKQVKPKTLVALFSSLIFGLLIPYIVFFTRRSMKKVVDSEIDLKVTTRLPLVGAIPVLGQGDIDDAFRYIRNQMLYLLDEGKKTILVTSANKGDGKTFCATRLAEAFTRMGENTICRHLHDVLPRSTDSVHPADLLAHKDLRQTLASLRESYDIIILDGPELDSSNEPLINGLADVTCFVCRAGKTTKAAIERLDVLKTDDRLTAPCLVLNQMGQ
jgi:Mrp family chromosome partitioning ATPase